MTYTLDSFSSHQNKIAILGLGYVGLPLAVELGKKYSLIGFDISNKKINELKQDIDKTGEVSEADLKSANIQFTDSPEAISDASIIIVTVPTPIDQNKKPDLTPVEMATSELAKHIKKGSIVVYESTVYPGVTEEFCAPIIERVSGLTCNQDFFLGYSPERLSPGEKNRTLTKIVKVVSGSTPDVANLLNDLYASIIPAGTHLAPSIKVAEAAKVIENTQRDLNVALMNELSIIFNKMGINTLDVVEAASTKWNFVKMTPGLVGGHCIGVDPYYLTYKAEQLGHHPDVILAGRRINDSMGKYVAEQTIKQLIRNNSNIKDATVLIMGLTFKENVSDLRNSKVVDIINELKEYGVNVIVTDPHADSEEAEEEYGLSLTDLNDVQHIDAVIAAVNHAAYKELNIDTDILTKYKAGTEKKIFIDIKSTFKETLASRSDISYWTL
jgi:UDP-N-acetyl-D-galactosamine dehydrogenase